MNNENLNQNKQNETKTYQYVYGVSFKKALQTYFFGYDDASINVNEKVVVDIKLNKCEDSLYDYECNDGDIIVDTSEKVIFIKSNNLHQKIKWELLDVQGRIVKKSDKIIGNTTIKYNELKCGVYFLNVVIGNKQVGKKIVVR